MTEIAPEDLQRPGLRGVFRALGGPGTGKSTLLVEVAAAQIRAGRAPQSVLLLTGSGRLAATARGALTARLLQAAVAGAAVPVVREPMVRSVHSYAFSVLRSAAARAGDPPPRLVTGAEQDGIIGELLAGDLHDGGSAWPRELRPALTTAGFATELRDLLARCAERGVDPSALQRLGRSCGRPEWVAAGRFARQYEQVMLLRASVGTAAPQASVPALGAAELVGAALEALAADAELLAAERARIGLLLVDDAQHLDPQAALLVRLLAAGADLAVLAADPNQAVFGFRGADPSWLLGGDTPVVRLNRSHRCAPAIARAVSAMACRLPAPVWRVLDGAEGADGTLSVRVAESGGAESALIADTLRRAHLVDGVAWSQMAVIVRSPSAAAALPRALGVAGVPVAPGGLDGPIADQPAVRALLTVLRVTALGVDGEQAHALLSGPIGRMDPVSLRQLRRALRRGGDQPDQPSGALLARALTGPAPQLPPTLARGVTRVRGVLAAAARSERDHHDPRYTLWQVWERSGLQRRWVAAAERGGAESALAQRNLIAVTSLFDIAEDYVARTAAASLTGLIDHVVGLRLPPVVDAVPAGESVAVLSPHAALGRDWELVIIAGLQDGLWPNTTPRGGILGTQRLLDVLDGLGDEVSARAPLLAEERRLLIAAMGRARRRLLVTAVDSDSGDEVCLPSPFLAELAALSDASGDAPPRPVPAPPVLSQSSVVGRLRAAVCAPPGSVDEAERICAANQLARLAAAGVPGADPAHWQGMDPLSTEEPLWSGEHIVDLSPSTLQILTDCPLRWAAERHGGSGPRGLSSTLGSLLHALLADSGNSGEYVMEELEKHWAALSFEAPWHAANELERHRTMVNAFLAWRAATRHELTEVGTEVPVEGILTESADGSPGVRVRGRIDRLERDAQGRLVVIDVKTAKTPATKENAQRNAQLGLYQLAVAAGLVPDGDQPGGGRLVYLGKPSSAGATEREQTALGPDGVTAWRDTVQAAAAATSGPTFTARINDNCAHCPMRPSCPVHARRRP